MCAGVDTDTVGVVSSGGAGGGAGGGGGDISRDGGRGGGRGGGGDRGENAGGDMLVVVGCWWCWCLVW